ncbi:MAG: hypothetical protein HUJ25_08580 [Crocinitomicaceae bacterium]|nr:hypothetical protein [Crocinitomicaceae bacterium]
MYVYFISLFIALSPFFTNAQEYDFTNSWQFLGPDQKPLEDQRRSANGIGPVEFIRASEVKEGWLLAGSINGGLFYSTDGGKQWYNAGSDEWPYSACAWGEFHPENEKIWFAYSSGGNDNGSPGAIGLKGAIYRTMDAGVNWEVIADMTSFINSEYMAIHGFRFHPEKPNVLYVFTAEGLYMTENCLASTVKWERITDLGGWIYDIRFTKSHVFLSHMQFGKWNVYVAPIDDFEKYKKIQFVSEMTDDILAITLEPYKEEILILTNYIRRGDELHKYSPITDEEELVLRGQRVIFGKGRTIAVSPHRPEELMIGYSTNIRRWQIDEKANTPKIKGGYHVDIEDVRYDPFDSMKVYIATHGGVYTTFDHGESWVSTSKGIGIAEVEGCAVSPIDPNVIAIGCYHDGSSFRADWEGNGIYQWKNVNGGDGLIPLLPDNDIGTIYTSNQYTGGGIYYSIDSGRTNTNIHNKKRLTTSGWRMTAVLHPKNQEMLFFNYEVRDKEGRGNVDVIRTTAPTDPEDVHRITNFLSSHKIEKYLVYGLYNSLDYPDELYAHVIEMSKNEDGQMVNIHRLFKTDDCTAPAEDVISSWYELEIPRSDWIADVTANPKGSNRVYLAYVAGIPETAVTDEEHGYVYSLKYKRKNNKLKREKDISSNIPYRNSGRYNLVPDGRGGMFFGTRTGVYYGDRKTLKGRRNWVKIGFGLPHCRVHGVYFNKKENSLTVGLYGRGVWKYYL